MKASITIAGRSLFRVFSLFLIVLAFSTASAQNPTGSCTVLHQPCNNDGILVVNITSGMFLPLTFTYYISGGQIIHSHINAFTDTISGIPSCNYVHVADTLGHSLGLYSGMTPPFYVIYPQITQPVCPDTMGTVLINIDPGPMPDSVRWYVGGLPGLGPYVGTGNPMLLPVGKYRAVVYDSGCSILYIGQGTADSNIKIAATSTLTCTVSTTPASCTNGTATISNISGGPAPFTFLWSNGANTSSVNNLIKGLYFVTITDAQGCSTLRYANISQVPVITVNVSPTNATCLQNNGSAIAFGSGGTSPYSYAWSNGMTSQSASGLAGGTSIGVVATDANGCIGNGTATIGSSTPVTVSYATTPSSCTTPTGSATLTISGGTIPYSVVWNTYPQQTGITISNMPAGSYSFTVTDAVGCIRSGTVTINPVSVINASVGALHPVCPSTSGYISLYVSGTNPPFSYAWSNGSATPSITTTQLITYCCTITDNVGCQTTKCVTMHSTSPVSVGLAATPASCIYTSDGSLYASANGGTAPYTYQWSNGQTGSTASGLAHGQYTVYVHDANGCSKVNYGTVGYNPNNDSCFCTITGKVYIDLNSNCVLDTNEQGIEHIMVHCSGFGYSWTDANGDYSFLVPSGNYTLSESVLYIYPLAPCQSNSIPVTATAGSGCVINVNFANVVNPLHDMHIITSSLNQAVPGFSYHQSIIVQNDGTISEPDIQLGYRHDGQLQYLNTLPVPFTQSNPISYPNWYGITTGFPTLAPGAAVMLHTTYQVPVNIPLSTTVLFYDTTANTPPMSNWLTDYSPWNNIDDFSIYTVGSYDPNFKEVSPRGTGPEGFISTNDSVLDYVIHFQNTGNYFAANVVLVDTLDSHLQWTSVRPGFSDHNYTADMSENGILKFTFSNINLPYKSLSEFGSMGMVTYSVKLKPQLYGGTEIKNTAGIYFDFNAPVMTNTTLNTIMTLVSTNDVKGESRLLVYPNPASSELFFDLRDFEKVKSIYVYDITGRLLRNESVTGNTIYTLNVQDIVTGIYFLVLQKENGEKVTAKFVKN